MSLTEKDIEELKNNLKQEIENYPDLEGMVAEGKLIYRSGWYEATDQSSLEAISRYASAVRVSKNGKAQIKVGKISKKLRNLAKRI